MAGTERRKLVVWLGVALFCALWWTNLDYRKLIKTDEGRYAEIAREMVATGDWVTPRSNGIKYFEKPPLQYWATAAAFEAFGLHEWTARLWTALTGFFGIVITWAAARRIWDGQTALAAAAILCGSLEWAALGHFATLDMSLSAFLAGAVAACCAGLRVTARNERRRWLLGAWVMLALAVLSKGVVALVLPAAAIAVYVLWQRDWRLPGRLELARGLLILAVLTVPWFVAVARANPEFLQFFFIHEHLQRYLTDVHGRDAPLWYFVPVLAAGLLPWTAALPQALREAVRAERFGADSFSAERFLAAWCAVTFIFFSVSHSKLESYILPLYPALAMLLARALVGMPPGRFRRIALPVVGIGLIIACGGPLALLFGHSDIAPELRRQYAPWLAAAGVVLAATAYGAARASALPLRAAAIGLLAAGGLAAAQLALAGHESLSPVYSSYHIALKAKPYLSPATPFFAVDDYDHTLPYYTGHTMTMVAYRDELAPGIASEPQKFIPTVEEFEAVWRAAPRAVAFMKPGLYDTLRRQGLPMTLIARDTRRVLVARP